MLSRELYRSHPDVIRTSLARRRSDADLDRLLALDAD